MKLFDRIEINVSQDDTYYEQMIDYNKKKGTIVGESTFLNPYITTGFCYSSVKIIKLDNGNIVCVLPEHCLPLI